MKKYLIKNEELNIQELINLEKNVFFRKVTPKFFSHDEDEYHIESKVELALNYIDENNINREHAIIFHKEHQIEYIGQEVEVEIDEFVELLDETSVFKEAKTELEQWFEKILIDFPLN